MAADGLPLSMLIQKVLDCLKRELRPISAEELKEQIGVDLLTHKALREEIKNNPKVMREPGGRWRWRSKYYLRNKDDLVARLRTAGSGIVMTDLYDSYKGVKEDIEEILAAQPRQVIKLRFAKRDILFAFEPELFTPVSEDIRAKFISVRVPDLSDVHNYLVRNGVKQGSVGDAPMLENQVTRKRPGASVRKRRNTRMKLTNTHLTNIDLSKDYEAPGAGSTAFSSGGK